MANDRAAPRVVERVGLSVAQRSFALPGAGGHRVGPKGGGVGSRTARRRLALAGYGCGRCGYFGGMTIPAFVAEDLERLEIDLPDGALDRLERYLDLLLKANETTNLTAIRHREQAWSRLIVDSLTPLPGVPDAAEGETLRLIDVGTGAGLPGMPLAIARPDVAVTLVDGTGKKVRFLESVVEQLGLENVTPLHARIEDVGQDPAHRGRYDVVTNRAVGPLRVVLEYSLPLLKVGGVTLAMKGPKAETELRESGDALTTLGAGEVSVVDAYPEGFDNELVIVIVPKADATPKDYPRLSGTPKKEPL